MAPPPPPRALADVAERSSEGFDPVVNGSSVSIPKFDAMVCERRANDRRAHRSHSPRSEMRLNRFGFFCLVLLTAMQSCDLITASREGGRWTSCWLLNELNFMEEVFGDLNFKSGH